MLHAIGLKKRCCRSMVDFGLMMLLFFVTGIATGTLSAMFGAGGGMVMVPVMYWIEITLGIPQQFLMHIAVGTSLAVMMIAIINTIVSHARSGNIQWNIVIRMMPLIALGAIMGSYSSRFIASDWLRWFFVAFLAYTIHFAWSKRKRFMAKYVKADFTSPSMKQLGIMAWITGVVSVWLGIGGSAVTIQFFRRFKMPMVNASATAAALIPAVAVFGAIGYVLAGMHATGLPPHMLGYVYEPALIGLTLGTFIGVPLGKRVVMHLPDALVSKIYVLYLVAVLISMAV